MPHKDPAARRAYVNARAARIREEDPERAAALRDKANEKARKKWAEDEAYRNRQKADYKKWYDEHGKENARERKGYRSWEVWKAYCDQKRERRRQYMRNWAKTEAGQRRKVSRAIKKRCGLSIVEYDAAYDAQGGRCKICNKETPRYGNGRMAVDHDHKTGKFRALLCTNCNTGIGLLGDSCYNLTMALSYLQSFEAVS